MAIRSVKEIQDGRDGVQSIDGVFTYTRSFRVITDNAYDEAEQILADGRIPAIGSPYPHNSAAYLESRDIKQDGQTKTFWTITCKYTTKRTTPTGGQQKNEDAYFDPPEINWTSKKKIWQTTVDARGNAIVNSAGDPFQTPPDVEKVYVACVYKRNVRAVSMDIFDLVDTVNASAVTIDGVTFPAGYCLIDDISVGGWKSRNNLWYREVAVNIVVEASREEYPHHLRIADMGMRSYAILWDENGDAYDDGELHNVLSDFGVGTVSHVAQPLDGTGYQKLQGDNTPYWLYFQTHTAADWSPLRLQ